MDRSDELPNGGRQRKAQVFVSLEHAPSRQGGVRRSCLGSPGRASVNPIALRNYEDPTSILFDTLYANATAETNLLCTSAVCAGSLLAGKHATKSIDKKDILREAEDFILQYCDHLPKKFNQVSRQRRWAEIEKSIESTGTYQHTPSELAFGAKTAWRNAPRCIGRIQWSRLQVYDARAVTTTVGMYEAICDHLKYATNGGNIRSALTVFRQATAEASPRIWNAQYVRYAGYENEDGTILGDPISSELTKICEKLGWKAKGGRSRFDILPLILSVDDNDPDVFPLPPNLVLEVPLVHPRYSAFKDLGLKWYAVPVVCNMALNCGGIYYPACGFNGWYQSTEIVRNLCDQQRYNLLKEIASSFQLDTNQAAVFWKDIALAELNTAIIYSFQARKITIVDQYSVAESFITHMRADYRQRGGCPADWTWIIPPLNPGATSVFHQEMLNYKLLPAYEYQSEPWLDHRWKSNGDCSSQRTKKFTFRDVACAVKVCSEMMSSALARRVLCTILYATETGKSQTFARKLYDNFRRAFNAQIFCMDEYDYFAIEHESLVLVVTSTFGNGEPPENGKDFSDFLSAMREEKLELITRSRNARKDSTFFVGPIFSVFGLGSRAYPNYCAFAHSMDTLLEDIGGRRLLPIAVGDDLCGQEESFELWSDNVFKAACDIFCIDAPKDAAQGKSSTQMGAWSNEDYRLDINSSGAEPPVTVVEGLSMIHKRPVRELLVSSVKFLGVCQERMIQVCLKKPADISYEPGDHVVVFPENANEMVESLLRRTHAGAGFSPDVTLQLQRLQKSSEDDAPCWKAVNRLPACSLRTALTCYLDICASPTRAFLCALTSCVASDADKQFLAELTTDAKAYESWRESRAPSLGDLLDLLPSLRFPAALLLALLPTLQPRYYSVSSSPDMYPSEVHLTVSLVKFTVPDTGEKLKVRRGLCSSWLASLAPGAAVRSFVKTSRNFHMPSDRALPIVMVGTGSGIAPFRGFWQQREYEAHKEQHENIKNGAVYLYYGCRTIADMAYRNEIELALKSGALTAAHTAFSRQEFVPKTYVQDELRRHAAQIHDVLWNQSGHLFICGDISVADDVIKTIGGIVQTCGLTSEADVADAVSQLKAEGRLHEDIFGLTLRSTIETAALRKQEASLAKYRQDKEAYPVEEPVHRSRKQYDFTKIEATLSMFF